MTIDDRLEKIWGHLSNKTPDEIREHIRGIRADRRLLKLRSGAKKTAKISSDTAKTKAQKLLRDVDPEMLERMLRNMQDGKGKS